MRENPELYEDFCRRCAARLQKDFPEESKTIAKIAELSPFFA
jgi:GTP cyclohydrolase FolE2